MCVCLSLVGLCACGLFNKKLPSGEVPVMAVYDRMVTVKGLEFHYTEYPGKGKDVVLLHGFGSSTYTWEEVAPLLNKEGYHVWALDLKGFGWSEKPLDSRYNIEALMEDVDDWMDVMKLTDVVMVGNSMGGAITAVLSKTHPERVSSMVLIDAGGYPMDMPMIIKLARLPMSPFFSKMIFGPWMIRMNLKEVMFDKSKVTQDRIDAYYKRLCTENAQDIQIKTARSIAFVDESPVMLATRDNTTKTLIIWGRDDAWIPLETVGYRFRKDLTNSVLSIIPQCGHVPQEEKPVETAKLILDFISKTPINDDGEFLLR